MLFPTNSAQSGARTQLILSFPTKSKPCQSRLPLDQELPFSSGMPSAANKYACTNTSLLSLRPRNCQNVFEAYCQQRFSERILIEFFPMVRVGGLKISGKVLKNKQHQWHTSNTKLALPLLEKERKAALKKKMSFDISPSSSFEFTSGDLLERS